METKIKCETVGDYDPSKDYTYLLCEKCGMCKCHACKCGDDEIIRIHTTHDDGC